MANERWEQIRSILYRWSKLGTKRTETGAVLIGHVSHVAPEAWFHTIYKPLTGKEIEQVEDQLKITLPPPYTEFLRLTNGLNVFSDALALYGLRHSYERNSEACWEPYDMVAMNEPLEKPRDASASILIIGSYEWDGSPLYIDLESQDPARVFRCSRESSLPLNSWDSFWQMLYSEVARLSIIYDEWGRKIDPNVSTIPVTEVCK